MLFRQRKICVVVEETQHEIGPPPDLPVLKGAVAAVVNNPFVGGYVADRSPATAELRELGEHLGELLISHLGGARDEIDGYGKGGDRRSGGRDGARCDVAQTRRRRDAGSPGQG